MWFEEILRTVVMYHQLDTVRQSAIVLKYIILRGNCSLKSVSNYQSPIEHQLVTYRLKIVTHVHRKLWVPDDLVLFLYHTRIYMYVSLSYWYIYIHIYTYIYIYIYISYIDIYWVECYTRTFSAFSRQKAHLREKFFIALYSDHLWIDPVFLGKWRRWSRVEWLSSFLQENCIRKWAFVRPKFLVSYTKPYSR